MFKYNIMQIDQVLNEDIDLNRAIHTFVANKFKVVVNGTINFFNFNETLIFRVILKTKPPTYKMSKKIVFIPNKILLCEVRMIIYVINTLQNHFSLI